MLYWSCEAQTKCLASPESVWALWSSLESWPTWDSGVQWARLETIFAQGEYFTMKPVEGPVVRCLLREVSPLKSFSTLSKLPLASMAFIHIFENNTLTHKVEIQGLLTPLFKKLFGYDIARALPSVVENVARLAKENQS